jgi:putative SOS response-associated peptidase YedK
MCGRFTLAITWSELARHYRLIGEVDVRPRFNIAPSQRVRIVRRRPAGNELAEARWGLVPSWAKDPKIGNACINARSETVAEKPAFRNAWRGSRRCVIPATGFFEWKQGAMPKQPFLVRLKSGGVMSMAGLWETWTSPEGASIDSVTIVTTAANDAIRPLHDRMPVMLRPEALDAWLDPSTPPVALTTEFRPSAAPELEAIPVSTLVNSAQNEDPRCVEPVAR